MIGLKRSLISLAAVMAIGSVANAATSNYVPLATDAKDFTWKLFGVDGLYGGSSSTAFSTGSGWSTLVDPTSDTVAVSGITVGTGDMMELKALDGTSDDLTSITINVDTTDLAFSETEPIRTMFVSVGGTVTNAMIRYKSSMEGEVIEIQYNGDTTVTNVVTLAAANTYDNPQALGAKTATGGAATLDTVAEAVDFDFSDNPLPSSSYDKDTDQTDANASESIRLYSYDSLASSWLIYDSRNAASANDFTTLEEGKGYWGRMNMEGGTTTVNTKRRAAGLIIGDSGLDSTDYTGDLQSGWNLLSYDSRKPMIRYAPTALTVVTDPVHGGILNIYDSTDTNFISVSIPAGTTTINNALDINLAVENAQARGDLSDTFDLRAFDVNTTAMVLISNKRFTLAEGNATTDRFLTVKTAGGQNPWSKGDSALAAVQLGQIAGGAGAGGARSIYGEYMILVEPLLGPDTAAELDVDSGTATAYLTAAIQIDNNTTLVPLAVNDTTTTGGVGTVEMITNATNGLNTLLAGVSTAKNGAGVGNALNLNISYDANKTNDWVLLSSDKKFYVRDHTFTRAITQTEFTGGAALTLVGNKDAAGAAAADTSISTSTTGALSTTAFNVDTTTGIRAYNTGTVGDHDIVLISATPNSNVFNIYDNDNTETIDDQLSLDTNITKGAIRGVAAVGALAKTDVEPYSITLDLTDINIGDGIVNAAGGIAIAINGETNTTLGAPLPKVTLGDVDENSSTALLSFFDSVTKAIKDRAQVLALDVVVDHNFTTDVNDTNNSFITISGYGVESLKLVYVDSGSGANLLDLNTTAVAVTTNPGTVADPAVLTADLKYNAVYTPDYATDGPLYTLKSLGYTALSIISGETDMDSGNVAWSSIDLTRDPDEMFTNQDFNLYEIDPRAGYWTYLETNAANGDSTNDLNATNLGTNNHTYIHHFDSDGTAQNHVSANINVQVTGLTAATVDTAVVYANVGGSKIELTSASPFTGAFSGDMTSYEVANMRASGAADVSIVISDGTQWKQTVLNVKTIDLTKPTVPTVNPSGAQGLTITPVSADTAAMYIFNGNIPESVLASDSATQAHANFIARMDANESSLAFCSNDNIVFGTTIPLQIVAIDGAGYFGQGNVSDIDTFNFAPATKSSVVLSHAGSGVATELGIPYDGNCTAQATETVDSGMSVKSTTAGVTVKLAYEKGATTFTTDIPYTVYFKDANDYVAEIKFVGAYAGTSAYIQFDVGGTKTMYSFTMPANDNLYYNSVLAYDLDTGGAVPAATVVTGQSF